MNVLKFGGLALAAFSLLNTKKSVGVVTQPVKNNHIPLLLLGGAVGVYLIFKYKPSKQQKQYLKEAKDRLTQLALDGIVASLPMAQFTSMANEIKQAIANCGTDEQAIYRQFKLLNNEADLMQLILVYGIAKYDGCFEGRLPSWNVHYTLSESISSDMSDSEVRAVNNILSSKRINFFF